MNRRHLKASFLDLHSRHPDWSANKISAELGCGSAYVRKTARRNGIVLRSAFHDHRKPWVVKALLPLPMKLLPVPVPGLHDWNERIASR